MIISRLYTVTKGLFKIFLGDKVNIFLINPTQTPHIYLVFSEDISKIIPKHQNRRTMQSTCFMTPSLKSCTESIHRLFPSRMRGGIDK